MSQDHGSFGPFPDDESAKDYLERYRQAKKRMQQPQEEWLRGRLSLGDQSTPPPGKIDEKPRPVPSPVTTYESPDHFLFLPDIGWNGQVVEEPTP